MRKRAMALVACLLAPACAGEEGALRPIVATAPAAYTLGPGDEVRVAVFGLDPMNNSYLVGDTGMIALPLLPPIEVSGKTIRETEAAIAAAIVERRLVAAPRVSAQVQTYRPFFILGEVQRPGQYPYVPGMSLLTAVSVAGGYTFRANTRTAVIRRQTVKGVADADTPVLPGDVIQIRESWF